MKATPAILPTRRQARGFTLIELMITIAVAIILAGIGLPSFRSMMASERINSESFDVIAMLTLTRSEALKRNISVTSTPTNGNWKDGWEITSAAPLPANCTPGSALAACTGGAMIVINRKGALSGSDITITCFQGTNPVACGAIGYGASGRIDRSITPQAPAIQILSSSLPSSGGQNARCITIDLSGQPRSKKGNC